MAKIYNSGELNLRFHDLIDNPSTRVPICLCVDTSGSMKGSHIGKLNHGIRLFLDSLRKDDIAVDAAEICIISFGGDKARLIQDYATADKIEPPTLSAYGATPMGDAVLQGLEMLRIRESEYQGAAINYYQPWLVIMSDGDGTDEEKIATAAKKVQQRLRDQTLRSIPIGIGDAHATLGLFAWQEKVYCLDELKFEEFFAWLSRSVAKVSESMPGERVNLEPTGSWEKYMQSV